MNYKVEKWKEPYSPDPEMLRKILLSEDYEVFQWSDNPGAVYGRHDHDMDQSHWIISGALELDVEGVGVFLLGPGDRDFMPGTRHAARVIGGEEVHYLIGAKR